MSKAERYELGLPDMEEKRQPKLAWLISEEKMAEVYPKVLDGSRHMFEKLMEPIEEVIQKVTLKVQPKVILKDRAIRNVYWTEKNEVILSESIPREAGKLLLWDSAAVSNLVADLAATTLCVAGDFVSYQPMPPKAKGGSRPRYDPNAPKTLRVKETRVGGKFKSYSVEYTERSVARGGYHSAPASKFQFARLGQSSLTCEWIRTPDDANTPLNANVFMDLGKGRGYLESVEGGTFYYPSIKAKPIEISEHTYPLRCMKYIPFMDAIQMVACPFPYVSYRGRAVNRDLMHMALLRLLENEPELEVLAFEEIPGERSDTQTLMTQRGIVRLMPSRHTPVGPKPGGLYWLQNSHWNKIWEGYPQGADVSANGCKIIFTAKKSAQSASGMRQVMVLDVCAAL